MKITKGTNNRCGIFLFYDGDGIVDEYILYMLRDLKKSIAHLLVVCNGRPGEEGLKALEEVSDEVLIRANSGFDVGGYREGLFYIGFKELQKYDEVILFNYTFFGAIYPFAEMFDAMDERDLDFWGITKHHKVPFEPYGRISYGYMPEHIQSHFIVVRRDMLMSTDYHRFMVDMKNPASYVDSICDYEAIFTKHFEDLGYKWDVYVNTDRYENYAYCPIMFYTKDMLEQDRCPIIKRRSFFTDYSDYLINTCGAPSAELYDYLCNNTDFDMNMIWDNILRVQNMSEVSRVLHLNYCLPEEAAYEEESLEDVTLAIWAKDIKNIAWYEDYFKAVKGEYRVILVGKKDAVACVKEKMSGSDMKNIVVCEKNVSGYQEFLREVIKVKDGRTGYYAFFVIDDIEKVRPYSNAISNIYKDWKCLWSNEEFVSNVKTTFKENPRMGMAVPPFPDFGDYFLQYADAWGGQFDAVCEYLDKIGVKKRIKRDMEPVAPVSGALWMTAQMLEGDVIARSLDTPAADEVYCFALTSLVQEQKAYTGTVYSNSYASIEITNSDHMLRELNKAVFAKYGPNYHSIVLERVKNNQLENPAQAGQQSPLVPASAPMPSGWKVKVKSVLKKIIPQSLHEKCKKIYLVIRGNL